LPQLQLIYFTGTTFQPTIMIHLTPMQLTTSKRKYNMNLLYFM